MGRSANVEVAGTCREVYGNTLNCSRRDGNRLAGTRACRGTTATLAWEPRLSYARRKATTGTRVGRARVVALTQARRKEKRVSPGAQYSRYTEVASVGEREPASKPRTACCLNRNVMASTRSTSHVTVKRVGPPGRICVIQLNVRQRETAKWQNVGSGGRAGSVAESCVWCVGNKVVYVAT